MLPILALLALQPATQTPGPWEGEVLYQIFPRSFRDSNGDGNGDFRGIMQGLDHIQELGCTAILLNPIYKARVYHNYFADDWFDTDPKFGTLQDFRDLVAEVHRRRMKLILDVEPQYVADGHPWFRAAEADPSGPEASYLWQPLPPKDSPSSWYDGAKVRIATVHVSQPTVKTEIQRSLEFWADQDVDGFRVDHMMDDLDWQGKDKDLYANFWTPIENDIRAKHPGFFFLAEQADWDSFRGGYDILLKTPTDACFDFRLRTGFFMFRKGYLERNIDDYRYSTPEGRSQVIFLENHDVTRFASEEPDLSKQKLAAGLMCSLKGIPSIYYGQEIGMRGRQGHWNSDGNDIPVRLGFRWGATLDAPGTPLWYKGTGPWWSTRYSADNDGRSLPEEQADPKSIYNWYRKLIAIRRNSPALSTGSQTILDIPNDYVTGVLRERDDDAVVVLANLSEKRQTVDGPDWPSQDLVTGQTFVAKPKTSLAGYQFRLLKRHN